MIKHNDIHISWFCCFELLQCSFSSILCESGALSILSKSVGSQLQRLGYQYKTINCSRRTITVSSNCKQVSQVLSFGGRISAYWQHCIQLLLVWLTVINNMGLFQETLTVYVLPSSLLPCKTVPDMTSTALNVKKTLHVCDSIKKLNFFKQEIMAMTLL